MRRTTGLAAVGVLVSTAAALPRATIPVYKRQNETTTTSTTFDDRARPSPEIDWQPCYQDKDPNLQCTWLTVPLDYENVSAGTADIAFLRYLLSEDAEDLYYNPGGPGGSGVETVRDNGKEWSEQWNMNIIGFDPRGISRSGPTIACNYATVNGTLKRRQQDSTVVGDLKKRWDDNLEFNTACSDNNKDSDAKYAGTSAVVQDIMYFVEKQAVLRGEDSPETKHVNYFGTSYGTLIGETLVAMYPDRIRRALLDANVYGVAHYQGWEPSGPDDFAHGIWLFSKLCFEAGEEFCTLAEGTNSIDEVQALFDGAYNYLKESPIECGDDALTTIDSNSFISDIGQSMYNARNNYLRIMLRTVAIQTALKTGNTSDICTLTARLQKLSKRDDVPETEDAVLLVTAIDIAGRFPWKTYEEWKAAVERLDATKPYGGFDYGAGNGLLGLAMDNFIPPPSQYFTGFENGTIYETPFPVLFVNTPGDPVTPMSSAYQMSKLFSGSSVFIVNVPGHGYGNAPSNCTNDILAAYFADGVVPELGTTCEADVEANYYFGGPDQTAPETS